MHYRMPIKLVRIQIISGQNLPKSKNDKKDIIDPYVSVKIRGAAADKHKFKTKHIDDNGLFEINIFKFSVERN